MAQEKVSGTTIGLVAGVPTIPATPTNVQISTAYDGQTYTTPVGCLLTQLITAQRDWEMGQDPATSCDSGTALRQSFKNNRIAANATFGGLMDYDEGFIELGYTLQADDVGVATYEIVHRSGAKVWAQGQVKQFSVDPSDVRGKLQFNFEWVYNTWPEFSAFLD